MRIWLWCGGDKGFVVSTALAGGATDVDVSGLLFIKGWV